MLDKHSNECYNMYKAFKRMQISALPPEEQKRRKDKKMEFSKRFENWKVSKEQINLIKRGDSDAIESFYFDNLPHITSLARNYEREKRKLFGNAYDSEGLVQQFFLDIPYLNWDKNHKFTNEVINAFFYYIYGGLSYVSTKNRKLLMKRYREQPLLIIDAPPAYMVNQDGYEFSLAFNDVTPYDELMKEEEEKRLSQLEEDLPSFLSSILTPKNIARFWKGKRYEALRLKADKVIEFLRAHKTPEYKLSLPVITEASSKKRTQEKKALMEWEEAHLEELPPDKQKKVKLRIIQRNYRERLRNEQRNSV